MDLLKNKKIIFMFMLYIILFIFSVLFLPVGVLDEANQYWFSNCLDNELLLYKDINVLVPFFSPYLLLGALRIWNSILMMRLLNCIIWL